MNNIRRGGCFAALLLSCMFGVDAFSQGFVVSDPTPYANLNLFRNKTSFDFPLPQNDVSGFSVKSRGAVFEDRLLPPDDSRQEKMTKTSFKRFLPGFWNKFKKLL